MDLLTIIERRKAIEQDAPCVMCGSTLAFCEKLRRENTDPTAPDWFGCCARGLGLRSCHHVPKPAALQQLLREIETGAVRPVEDVLLDSIEEFPLFSVGRRGRSMRARVMAMADESWPDNVPMGD